MSRTDGPTLKPTPATRLEGTGARRRPIPRRGRPSAIPSTSWWPRRSTPISWPTSARRSTRPGRRSTSWSTSCRSRSAPAGAQDHMDDFDEQLVEVVCVIDAGAARVRAARRRRGLAWARSVACVGLDRPRAAHAGQITTPKHDKIRTIPLTQRLRCACSSGPGSLRDLHLAALGCAAGWTGHPDSRVHRVNPRVGELAQVGASRPGPCGASGWVIHTASRFGGHPRRWRNW